MRKSVFLPFIGFILMLFMALPSSAQDIPLVYSVEHTGAAYPAPVLPSKENLPTIEPLPDPFAWSDGSGRDTTFTSWSHRRAEIKAEIEHYEIGTKPPRPDSITASYADNILTVNITVNDETLTLSSPVILPEGEGPFPAVIGMGGATGSLPASIFSSRDVAQIAFNFGQVMAHTQTRGSEPINRLYPELIYMGAYSAWSWGVSRLIDGLELVADSLPIDLEHLAVTGCSFAGKMALFAGAFDERIALTIAQEPGGGGAAAWRVSETLGDVETLGATSHAWFIEDMFQFAGTATAKLPHDHHELMAMVAPRALLVLGNPDYTWLAEESGYVSSRAAHEVWKNFGIDDRFGFSIVGGHGHCALPASQYPEVEAFVDKFLLGDTTANTEVTKHPFEFVDYSRWFEWWGSGVPEFPERNTGEVRTLTFEAECASPGADYEIKESAQASNGRYVTVKAGTQSLNNAPSSADGHLSIPFTVDTTGVFSVFARLNCPSYDDDSFWVKMDNESFEMYNGLVTTGWEWIRFRNWTLQEGDHTLTIGYREDGALIDKISISTSPYPPEAMGQEAADLCPPMEDTASTKVPLSFFFEAECGSTIEDQIAGIDTLASNGSFIQLSEDGVSSPDTLLFSFTLTTDDTFRLYARVTNASDENSVVVNLGDSGDEDWPLSITWGWEWLSFPMDFALTAGEHTLLVLPGDGNAAIDKLCITNDPENPPAGLGETALNLCVPDTSSVTGLQVAKKAATRLRAIYPNPASGVAHIPVIMAEDSHISLKVYNLLGIEVTELAGSFYTAGKHIFEFFPSGLPDGMYYCTLRTETHTESARMILRMKL